MKSCISLFRKAPEPDPGELGQDPVHDFTVYVLKAIVEAYASGRKLERAPGIPYERSTSPHLPSAGRRRLDSRLPLELEVSPMRRTAPLSCFALSLLAFGAAAQPPADSSPPLFKQ